jgi:hypothetical protein
MISRIRSYLHLDPSGWVCYMYSILPSYNNIDYILCLSIWNSIVEWSIFCGSLQAAAKLDLNESCMSRENWWWLCWTYMIHTSDPPGAGWMTAQSGPGQLGQPNWDPKGDLSPLKKAVKRVPRGSLEHIVIWLEFPKSVTQSWSNLSNQIYRIKLSIIDCPSTSKKKKGIELSCIRLGRCWFLISYGTVNISKRGHF